MTAPDPTSPPARAGALWRRTQLALVAAAALLLALAFALPRWLGQRNGAAPSAPATPSAAFRPTPAQWDELEIEPVKTATFINTISADGAIAYDDDATTPVFSPYSGRVTRVIAKPGDRVARGAPLLALEASELAQGQADLVAALGALATAQSQATLAEKTERRQHELLLAKAGAEKDWLQSQADLAAAQNALRSAESGLAAVRNRLRILGRSESEIAALEHAGNLPQANAEAIVRAPLAGTVLLRQVGPGQYIQSAAAGASAPIYQIGDLASVWVVGNVRETDAPLVRLGASVEVHVPALPDRTFKAHVSMVAAAIDATTHRLPVRVTLANPDGALKPTMFATLRIAAGEAHEAPALPPHAIVYEGADAHVYVANDDRTLAIRRIRTGRADGALVEVIEGLAAGERVVGRGALFIDRAATGD